MESSALDPKHCVEQIYFDHGSCSHAKKQKFDFQSGACIESHWDERLPAGCGSVLSVSFLQRRHRDVASDLRTHFAGPPHPTGSD
jgi:hypothetical protein